VTRIIILLLATALIAHGQQRPDAADLILHNGVIWTVDEKNPMVQAVAIKDGKFIVVGSNKASWTRHASHQPANIRSIRCSGFTRR
jgi:hypothetical protein